MRQGYALDSAWPEERQRLAALEALYDPITRAELAALGVSDGWTVLDVGAGAGSTARWLAEAVAPSGRVVATDIDIRYLSDLLDNPNVEVRVHDIVKEPLEADTFDLIHTRMLLTHIPEREAILDRVVAALKPGGWLLAEELDFDPPREPTDHSIPLWKRVEHAFFAVLTLAGAESVGRRLPQLLWAHGLDEIGNHVQSRIVGGGAAERLFFTLSCRQLRDPMVGMGLLTSDEVDTYLAQWEDPTFSEIAPLLVSSWGRKPPALATGG